MSSVEYIHMSKTEMEMQVNTYDVVFATAIPIDAPNRTLCYESDRPEIVSMNSNNGQVRANSIGTARIKVYLESNPSIYAICTITVKGYIPVRSIRFPVTEFTLLEGRTMTLGVLVEPSNATNPKVTWRSCSPEIATVSSTGNVKAIKPGVVDIYATAENGSLTAKCTIRVVIDNVTIKQQGIFCEITFENSGKTWKSIGHDMIYGTDGNTTFLIDRCNNNYFKYPEQYPIPSEPKEYSDDELRLLYAIDPYGVAEYIYRYADRIIYSKALEENKDTIKEKVKYKDKKYEAIFGEKPKYFKRKVTNQIEWVETTDTNNIEAVLSASESLFGFRKVDDGITALAKQEFNHKVIKAIISCCFKTLTKNIPALKDAMDEVDPYVKLFQMSAIMTKDDCAEELVKYSADEIYNKIFEYTNLVWVGEALSLIDDLAEMDRASIPDINFCGKITACYAESVYNITFETSNGKRFPMKDVHEAIAMLN